MGTTRRRFGREEILLALLHAGVEGAQREEVLEILESLPTGRRATDDVLALEDMLYLVIGKGMNPYRAARSVSQDLTSTKRRHRKYLKDRAALEEGYVERINLLGQAMKLEGEERSKLLRKVGSSIGKLPRKK